MRLEPDAAQTSVLEHERGALLVKGAPGSGKTTLLRERFARLVDAGADPGRVALFTLNRRAAREARDHIIRRVGRSVPELPVFTVHGFAFRALGSHFSDLGYDSPPEVLSAPEQYAVVRELLSGEQETDWPRFRGLLAVPGFARQVADFVLRAQERLLDPDSVDSLVEGSGLAEYREIARFYRRYLEALSTAGQADFATLLFQAVSLLERGSGERFDHVMIDDYQDATHAAEGILQGLARAAQSVVVCADPAGHVFSYRGGSLEPLGRVAERMGPIKVVELRRSYRMGEQAARLAPLDDPSHPPAASGDRIEARLFAHPGEEMEAVAAELLRARVEDDLRWEEMAVILRRYGEYLTALRHALIRHAIPFVIVAEEAAVASEPANRPVIDLFRYVFRPEVRKELLEPVLSSFIGGLDPHALRRLRREARKRDVSPLDLIHSERNALPPDLNEPVERFRRIVKELSGMGRVRAPDALFFWLWAELPVFRDMVESGDARRDLDALAALSNVLSRFSERRPGSTVEDYLDTLDAAEFGPDPWIPPEERHPHAVRVISAHRAQGVEFELALVPGCLEGEFPSLSHRFPLVDLERLVSPRSPSDRLQSRLAEERALFRLAVSRARRTVLLASQSGGTRNGRTPSRFPSRLGLQWSIPGNDDSSTSLRAMETSLRKRLADPSAARAQRLAALAVLSRTGADPRAWWGRFEWTDPGVPLFAEDIHTSYSKLSVLQNCALQYLYQVELGLDPEETHQMWLGSVVHEVIDRVQQGEIERSEPAVLSALEERWRDDVFPNRAVEHRRRLDAEAMLRRWLQHEQPDPVFSEVRFSFPLNGGKMRGRIDAVFQMANGHLRVVDYKTSRYPISQQAAKEDLQLAAYYLAVKRDASLNEVGEPRFLQLAYLGKADTEKGFARRSVSPGTIANYDTWAEQTLVDLLDRVRQEDFAPNPEADCTFCAFKTICPVWPQGQEVLQ
jgi:superfamily I DNA/RNA helicase/RecB family exonuclease